MTGTATGATSITATAATKGGTGIRAVSTTGNILADGGGTGTATGTTVDGILYGTVSGNQTVQNFATVDGLRNGMWLAGSIGGTTSLQGNGLVGGITGTTLNGIVVGPSSGNVGIGNVATNGVILGGVNGICVNNTLAGTTSITVDKNVTGTLGDGILSTTQAGNQTNSILGPAIVQGALYGLATGTITGTATTNNTGTIQNIGDAVGAPGNPGLQAVWLGTGTNIVNNNAGGKIIGGFTTGGLANTLNNNASGTWTPSLLNAFAGINDQVNNAGLINIRTGNTLFTGVEKVTNQAGGVIDLTYGGTQATNTLTIAGGINSTFAPLAGSTLKMAFNPALGNNAGLGVDSSSNGKGTADTVLATLVTPGAKSTINLTTVGSVAGLIGTSGSVALVQSAAILANPGMGAAPSFVPSAFYTLAGDPSTGAVKFNLTDAPDGGVFLQWSPNLTPASLGAFAGGNLNNPAAAGSRLGAASGGFAGVGGIGGSGGASAGASGAVADAAAGSAAEQGGQQDSGQPGGAKTGACGPGRNWNVWLQGDGLGSRYSGGASGSAQSATMGLERDLGDAFGAACGRIATGVFGSVGGSRTSFDSGSTNSTSYSAGAFIRTASAYGLYASVLGVAGRSDAELKNSIFGSTAKQHSDIYGVVANVGYVHHIGRNTWFDLRGLASYGQVDGGGFTDSVGISVSQTTATIRTLGTSLGLHHSFSPGVSGFIRGGVKWTELNSSITAFGITLTGKARQTYSTAEAGFTSKLSENASFTASGFGQFSKNSTGYGGSAKLAIRF